jgi:DNA-binding SARP family transcriptional activator
MRPPVGRPYGGQMLSHTGGAMEIRVLGPVEVTEGGEGVLAGQPRQRCVLAALAVDAGRLVPVHVLIDRVWGQGPPAAVRHAVYVYTANLRKTLRGGLVRRSGGYVLDVDPEVVDLHRFRALVARAVPSGGSDADRVRWLREALRLWRGEPLAGLTGEWAERARQAWERQRLDAVALWAGLELRLGNHTAMIGTVEDLLCDHPLVESLAAVLVRGLHATGRTAEALGYYMTVRRRLVEEFGAEPGAELRAAHMAVLSG